MPIYNFILTEGDLRKMLTRIEQARQADDKPYCLEIYVETDGELRCLSTVTELRREMIAEIAEKGQIYTE